ncbi:hypothetical protein C1645_808723 [Glomus cerebriforme]|uniref:Uncharacterized protein n=1 Tax=Glomus cerebriforme TaxID=658196 RepID=A0A397SKK4_9GLOM|nr:hypothetical protein C1645_808723 [Glomus cerebriforme]
MSDIVNTLKSFSIINKLSNEYPETAKLLRYNIDGTVKLLKAKNVLFTYRSTKQIKVSKNGTDNIKAWEDYKTTIDKYLYDMNDQEEVGLARETLSDHIHKEHYDRYPFWPSVGKTQSSIINVRITQAYNYDPWYIVWSSDGYVEVTDKRPAVSEYYAEFVGKPDLKLVKLDESRMKTLEYMVQQNYVEAQKQVDILSNKELTWDNF